MNNKHHVFIFSFLLFLLACNYGYHAGNVGLIGVIHTKIDIKIIQDMSDSLFVEGLYVVPEEYKQKTNFRSVEHKDYRDYYFKESPKEVYTVSLSPNFGLHCIYDLEKDSFLDNRTIFDDAEMRRIRSRVKNTLFKDIVNKAKEYGLCDCEIYAKNPYIYYEHYDEQPPSDSMSKVNKIKADSLKYACRFISNVGEWESIALLKSKIKTEMVQQLTDSLNGKYDLPKEMARKRFFKDMRAYYFSSPPEEMYFVLYNYNLSIHHIYNFSTDSVKYKSDNISKSEKNRIETRFKNTVLKDIEAKAKELGIPDSVLYKQPL